MEKIKDRALFVKLTKRVIHDPRLMLDDKHICVNLFALLGEYSEGLSLEKLQPKLPFGDILEGVTIACFWGEENEHVVGFIRNATIYGHLQKGILCDGNIYYYNIKALKEDSHLLDTKNMNNIQQWNVPKDRFWGEGEKLWYCGWHKTEPPKNISQQEQNYLKSIFSKIYQWDGDLLWYTTDQLTPSYYDMVEYPEGIELKCGLIHEAAREHSIFQRWREQNDDIVIVKRNIE